MELNLAEIHEGIAATVPDRPCLVFRDRTFTWADVTYRTRRLANLLLEYGITRRRTEAEVEPWESPQAHVALYLHNGNEYLEGMLGAYKAAAAPFNVNYRYVAEELAYLLDDAGAEAVVYHGAFADTLADVLPRLRRRPVVLLRVDDGSGDELLPGAWDYEAALDGTGTEVPDVTWSPDDRYLVYTGGTTGQPKGVLWRQADFLVAALGVRRSDGTDIGSLRELAEAAAGTALRTLPAPPFMHGAAHWNALSAWVSGGTVVVQDHPEHLDPADVLDTCARQQVTALLIVGDAFALPLVDELRAHPRDLRSLRFVLTGGAILSASVKAALLDLLPGVRIVDVLGSSETGRQGTTTSGAGAPASTGRFRPSATTVVLSDDRSRLLEVGDPELGWLAQTGRVPLGYLGDPDKTRATFPVVAGQRCAISGDRARLLADGEVELHGRESSTINTGGEKVFAEEVEHALKHHPDVYDALVVGRPSERWGQEVVAVVALRPGASPSDDDLCQACDQHLARYKWPRRVVRVDRVLRSPSGKPDYAWARSVVGDNRGG